MPLDAFPPDPRSSAVPPPGGDAYRALLDQGVRYEMGGLLDRALACYRDASALAEDSPAGVESLWWQSRVYKRQCQWEAALATARQSQAMARRLGDPDLVAESLNAEASLYHALGQEERGEPLLREILTIAREPRVRGHALQNLAINAANRGDLDEAAALFADALATFDACGFDRGRTIALNNLGRLALDRGRPAEAIPYLAAAREAARALGDEHLCAVANLNKAQALLDLGQPDAARDPLSEALGHYTACRNAAQCADCYQLLGDIHAALGDDVTAGEAYRAGLRAADQVGLERAHAALSRRVEAVEARQGGAAPADDALPPDAITDVGAGVSRRSTLARPPEAVPPPWSPQADHSGAA